MLCAGGGGGGGGSTGLLPHETAIAAHSLAAVVLCIYASFVSVSTNKSSGCVKLR